MAKLASKMDNRQTDLYLYYKKNSSCNKTWLSCINKMKGVILMLILTLTSMTEFTANTDADLDQCIASIAEKSSDALADLYHQTSTAIYGFSLSILKNTQDAEDVLHDCYISIYSSAAAYQSCGKPMAWIFTIARNLCLMKLREHSRMSDIPPEDWEPYLTRNGETSPEDRLILTQCMTLLSDEERQIVMLHALTGFKHREIAQILDMPLPTVLSKYHRALKKLKKFLEKGE